jgi:hypothetical protein
MDGWMDFAVVRHRSTCRESVRKFGLWLDVPAARKFAVVRRDRMVESHFVDPLNSVANRNRHAGRIKRHVVY